MAGIYISSTYGDLKECREAVYHALLTLRHDVVAMEDYVATDRRPVDKCLADVEACDLYVGIFAWRYGYVPEKDNPEKKSITELEFRHAVAKGIPCLLFLLDENAAWPYPQIERGEGADKLRLLRDEMARDYTVSFFSTCEQLATRVTAAVAGRVERRSGADSSPPGPKKVSTSRLPVTGTDLFGREEHLRRLDEAWANRDAHVLSFVAWGGVGKSALVNHWLALMARDDYRGAEHVYGWSFYSQGTTDRAVSADQFIEAALVFFGDTDPNRGSPWDKGERLAQLIGRRRTLLVLDGLEPLQSPPGPEEGRLKEQSMQALLRGLAAHSAGLCVISTRVPVTDLSDYEGGTVMRVELETLSPEAGAQVLTAQGAKGTQATLEQASREFGGHSLALTLLGSYLSDVYGGDIARRTEVRGLEDDERHGRHAQRVMTSYERWLGEGPELSVLRLLGLFNRPANKGSIDALRAAPAISGLTDALQGMSEPAWQRTLSKLRRTQLLAKRDDAHPDTLDAHPLIREHFGQQLQRANPAAWREGNSLLYEHLRDTTPMFPETIEEMAPLYASIMHGCAAGRYEEALMEVYFDRVSRGDDFFTVRQLGAFGADLAALSSFFSQGWQQPSETLSKGYKSFVLHQAGAFLRAVGRTEEAIQLIRASVEDRISLEAWEGAAKSIYNLSLLYLSIGELDKALSYARQGVELASHGSNPELNKTLLAHLLYQTVQISEAEALFCEVEETQKKAQPRLPILYSLSGLFYSDLLLHRGKYQEVIDRMNSLRKLAKESTNVSLLDHAVIHLSLGQALLLKARKEGLVDLTQATYHLDQAVHGLRNAGEMPFFILGLLSREALHRVKGDFDQAQADLAEAMSIATRGGMRLYQADCHLEYARLHLAEEPRDVVKAREHLEKAREMIERMGYHLRDEAVRELEERLKEV